MPEIARSVGPRSLCGLWVRVPLASSRLPEVGSHRLPGGITLAPASILTLPCPSASSRALLVRTLLTGSQARLFRTSTAPFHLFAISWAAPVAYGGSQAGGQIRAIATGLGQSHSNVGSEPHLQPTPHSWQRRILNPLTKARD